MEATAAKCVKIHKNDLELLNSILSYQYISMTNISKNMETLENHLPEVIIYSVTIAHAVLVAIKLADICVCHL